MRRFKRVARGGGILAAGLLALETLSGCIVVGVSNRQGWFLWPRGYGLLFVLVMLVFLLRRRR